MSIKFGVIADIHGNFEGLQAALKKLCRLGAEEIFCLGDVVGYGAEPELCWATVKRTCSLVLEGNHEAILTGKIDNSHCSALGQQSAIWTRAHVSDAVRSELAKLPFRAKRYGAVFYHSSPQNDGSWPYLNQTEQIMEAFTAELSPLVFYGHTHRPRITLVDRVSGAVIMDELIQKTKMVSVNLSCQCCYINPGSVGQQRDTHTDASFAVCELDGKMAQIQVLRIPYRRFRTYQKLLNQGCGKEAAVYLIREKGRRRLFALLDYRRWRLCRHLFDK